MKKIKAPIRYCSYCGKKTIARLKGAELNMMYYGDEITGPIDTKYNQKTGKRNYCFKYTCPDWHKVWWGIVYSKHDDYFVDKVFNL